MSYTPFSNGLWVAIETVTVSNQATVEMDLTGSKRFYAVHIRDLIPISDNTELLLKVSTDGGSNFLGGASDYAWGFRGIGQTSGAGYALADSSDDSISITADVGSGAALMGISTAESLCGWIYIYNSQQADKVTNITTDIIMREDSTMYGHIGRGGLKANLDVIDAIELTASSGNLSTGTITLFGMD